MTEVLRAAIADIAPMADEAAAFVRADIAGILAHPGDLLASNDQPRKLLWISDMSDGQPGDTTVTFYCSTCNEVHQHACTGDFDWRVLSACTHTP